MTSPPGDPLQALRELVVRIDTKLDLIIARQSDHEERIRKLESGRWPLPSLAVLISLASLVLAVLVGTGVFR